jgi:hypothetical protein
MGDNYWLAVLSVEIFQYAKKSFVGNSLILSSYLLDFKTVYPSVFFLGLCCSIFSFQYSVLYIIVCPYVSFLFNHCIICPLGPDYSY